MPYQPLILKDDMTSASLAATEDDISFRVKTYCPDFATGDTLSQAGQTIAFFSKTLNTSELKYLNPPKKRNICYY